MSQPKKDTASQKAEKREDKAVQFLLKSFARPENSIGMYAVTSKDDNVIVIVAQGGWVKRILKWLKRVH